MKKNLLLAHKFKYVGLVMFLLGILFTIFVGGDDPRWLKMKIIAPILQNLGGEFTFFGKYEADLGLTIMGVLLIGGSLLIAFSKEKTEDEFINSLRLRSFQLAVLVNFVLLFLGYLLLWGGIFLDVVFYNMFSTLVLFIIIFHLLLLRNKYLKNEK